MERLKPPFRSDGTITAGNASSLNDGASGLVLGMQSLACADTWKIDPDIVNTWGGAIAIGHPLGASGARILGTLAHRLSASNQRWGVAAICIGVGQALAVVLENVTPGTE